MPRYTVAQDFEHTSEGGHDVWRVLDGARDAICDCFDEADATMIADALNACRRDGVAIVPIEPTDEMIVAGGHIPWSVQDFWEIMLAAAPKVGK